MVAVGDRRDPGQGLQHLFKLPVCQDESRVMGMPVMAPVGNVVMVVFVL